MVRRKEKCGISVQGYKICWHLLEYGIYAVLLAFKATRRKKTNAKITQNKHGKDRKLTNTLKDIRNILAQSDKTKDKLIKGFGVSLAKTPFEMITPKSGYSIPIFFFCACCVFVLFCYVSVDLFAVCCEFDNNWINIIILHQMIQMMKHSKILKKWKNQKHVFERIHKVGIAEERQNCYNAQLLQAISYYMPYSFDMFNDSR